MSALHAAPALRALPDGHIKAPDDRPDDGEIFLVLRRHALQCHRPAAPRTRCRERGLVGRINPGGNRATRPASIPTAGPPPRPPAAALGSILGEWRGLPETGPPRGRELPRQVLVLPVQSIAFARQPIPFAREPVPLALAPRQLLSQTRDRFVVVSDPLDTIGVCGTCALIGHARVMADSTQKYKYKIVAPQQNRWVKIQRMPEGSR